MKLKYFAESAYTDLYDSIKEHETLYANPSNAWVKEYFGDRVFCKDSRIECTLPTLSAANDEYTNVIAIYEAFKDKLNPKQASNPYLWAYLTHCEYWEYANQRWAKEGMSVDTIKQRFFCSFLTNNLEGNRVGFLRNAVSRLWWFGYLSYQENRPGNPYELTKLLLSHSDISSSVLERKLSVNRNITVGVLDAILEINNDPRLPDVGVSRTTGKYEWRELCKYINRYGGVTLLDAMSSDDIKELSYNFILNQRKIEK